MNVFLIENGVSATSSCASLSVAIPSGNLSITKRYFMLPLFCCNYHCIAFCARWKSPANVSHSSGLNTLRKRLPDQPLFSLHIVSPTVIQNWMQSIGIVEKLFVWEERFSEKRLQFKFFLGLVSHCWCASFKVKYYIHSSLWQEHQALAISKTASSIFHSAQDCT